MKIHRVRLEIREAVLCASVKIPKVDFNTLSPKEQIKELQRNTPRKILNLFKNLKIKDNEVLTIMLKKCPAIIENIKRPTLVQLKQVLDTHPHALNKLASNKRTENLVIQAIRPEKRHLFGPRSERATHTLKNILALAPNTSFTPRVYHEVVRLMCGAPEKTIKKLIATFDKQKKKIPEELRSMVQRIKAKTLGSTTTDPDSIELDENIELSIDPTKSIIRVKYAPYTLTVKYPDSPEYNYEYYIGDWVLYKKGLALQYNPGEFSKWVKENKFSVKKIKMSGMYDE